MELNEFNLNQVAKGSTIVNRVPNKGKIPAASKRVIIIPKPVTVNDPTKKILLIAPAGKEPCIATKKTVLQPERGNGRNTTALKVGSWTAPQSLELIGAIKENPCLYQIKHPDYLDRRKKDDAFNRIREFISGFRENTTVKEITAKWNSLRTQFLAEHKKVLDSMRTGTGKDEVYSPNMTHYCDLLFLTDHIAIRQPQSNEAFGIENEENIDEDLYHDDLPSTSLAGPPVKKRKSKANNNTTNVDGVFIDFLNEAKTMFKPAQPPTAVAPTTAAAPLSAAPLTEPQDEFAQLGNLVATKLRAMPVEQSKKISSQIVAILYT